MTANNSTPRRSSIHVITGLACGALILIGAISLLVTQLPSLRYESPSDRLAARLLTSFPSSQAEVTGAATEELHIKLKVRFDPTVAADQAQAVFTQVAAIAEQTALKSVKTMEITLIGLSAAGGSTSTSRTTDYESRVSPKQSG